jgi:DinB superfamily
VDRSRRDELLASYREGPAVIEAAVAGLGDAELDRRPADGGWTAREVVHHLADSEMTSAIRLRKLLAEDSPTIQGYDEAEFARRLHYDSRPIGPSVAALRAARETTAAILERLGDEDWRRSGTHTESGPYSVETWLEIYAAHAHDHAEQIDTAVGRTPASD